LEKGIEAFDKYTLWALNYAAVANISQFGGRYREEPIYVGNHKPPHFKDVPNQMDRFFSVIHENWTIIDDPTTLPAYALWRLNWITRLSKETGELRGPPAITCFAYARGACWVDEKLFLSVSGRTGGRTMMLFKQPTEHGSKAILM
jgi:hypothetical protein